MINLFWTVVFTALAVALTLFGYGYVHDGTLGALIFLSVLAAAGSYLKYVDGRRR